jgi:hypothetical protein
MVRIFEEHVNRLEDAMSALDEGEKQDAIGLLKKLGLAAAATAPAS